MALAGRSSCAIGSALPSAVASSLPCPQGKRARRLQLDPAEGALADRLEAPRDKSGLSAYYAKLSTAAVTKAGARWFVDARSVCRTGTAALAARS